MARAMLEYTKTVLEKVSFNMGLFKRELKKAMNYLLPNEIDELLIWLRDYSREKPEVKPAVLYLESKRNRSLS
ncbi:MAG: hypothetical protein MRY51_09605 [Flavobacteriaceae bacterium]|jgi:hypothetical protein|nr:hypothetical protein [Flavobacteriaceae bacterium]MCI5088900.1 hypothetical protein [Flavobacteriaceae bacterium]CAI8224652.1 MAG: Uncharacterised protein [SAR116 cluster bacterium]